jgi:hypothetical protein
MWYVGRNGFEKLCEGARGLESTSIMTVGTTDIESQIVGDRGKYSNRIAVIVQSRISRNFWIRSLGDINADGEIEAPRASVLNPIVDGMSTFGRQSDSIE